MSQDSRRGRVRPRFTPKWVGEIEGFTVTYCKKHEWQVLPDMDFFDLYQEAWLLFNRCRYLYPEVVEARHFMALYKTALWRMVACFAKRRLHAREKIEYSVSALDPYAEGSDTPELAAKQAEPQASYELEAMLHDAPAPIKRLVRQIGMQAIEPIRRKRKLKLRETTQDFLSRIAQVDSYSCSNVVREIVNWINGDAHKLSTVRR